MLCENTFNGGYGYTLNQVADMTPDQICTMLCDAMMLKGKGQRTRSVKPWEIPRDKGGFAKGRAADGTPMKARFQDGS